jgi:hypothetical protein
MAIILRLSVFSLVLYRCLRAQHPGGKARPNANRSRCRTGLP